MSNRKQYKTARGQKFDFDAFVQDKTDSVSVGNLGGKNITNARGDILGKGGQSVVQHRTDAVRKFYRDDLPVIKEQVSIKDEIIETPKPKAIVPDPEIIPVMSPADAIVQVTKQQEMTESKVQPKRKSKPKNDQ